MFFSSDFQARRIMATAGIMRVGIAEPSIAFLLQHLRAETIDWAKNREKYTSHTKCAFCGFEAFKQDFSIGQWNRGDKRHCCKTCLEEKKENGNLFQCKQWGNSKTQSHSKIYQTERCNEFVAIALRRILVGDACKRKAELAQSKACKRKARKDKAYAK